MHKWFQRSVCWYVTWPCDDLWPFDLEQLSYMVGHVTCPATKFEDYMARSWVMSPNVFHWIGCHWHCVLWLLCMHHVTWPVCRVKFYPHIWNPQPWFVYSLCNFGGSTMHTLCRKPYELLFMREITLSVKDALDVLLQSFSTTSVYRIGLQKLSI